MATKAASMGEAKLARVMDYQLALSGLSRIASELMPRDRLLHHAAAVVSRVTHISHVKVLCYRPEQGDLLMIAGVG